MLRLGAGIARERLDFFFRSLLLTAVIALIAVRSGGAGAAGAGGGGSGMFGPLMHIGILDVVLSVVRLPQEADHVCLARLVVDLADWGRVMRGLAAEPRFQHLKECQRDERYPWSGVRHDGIHYRV